MSEKFSPVNPFHMSDEDRDRYFDEFEKISKYDGEIATIPYKGSKIFTSFVKDKRIGVGAIIRIHQPGTTSLREHYIVTSEGLRDVSGVLRTPESVLDTGELWNIEGHDFIEDPEQPKLLPEV